MDLPVTRTLRSRLKSICWVLVFCAIVLFPMAVADTNTTDPYHYLTTAEHLAGPRDMSIYSRPEQPVPAQTMNETTARLSPNVTACGKDGCLPKVTACIFPFIPCGQPLTLQIVYNVNVTRPDRPGPIVGYSLSGWPLQDPFIIIPAGMHAPQVAPAASSRGG